MLVCARRWPKASVFSGWPERGPGFTFYECYSFVMNTSPYPHLQKIDDKPVTIADLKTMKARGEKIACLTAYDASFAALEDRAGVDVVLVGDSLGMVVQGRSSTTGVAPSACGVHRSGGAAWGEGAHDIHMQRQ